jgi:hypothetical protein
VWNYAQALPYLFPALERSMRTAHFKHNLHASGHLTFRIPLPMGSTVPVNYHAAADGQMGDIMKTYRDWLICGDDEWLRELWPAVKRALEYAWKYWDRDRDGMMENTQHNTYDVEFFGPNTMMGSLYLGALRAGEEMARRLGDNAAADEYHAVYEKGRWLMDEQLFNGEYYIQDVRPDATASEWPVNEYVKGTSTEPSDPEFPKYQCGQGCLSDQMIGQWFARMLALGDLFDADHVRSAMASIFKYNWRESMAGHANTQRIYAINDESGLVACTWPRGGRPRFPFPYSDEAWSGIEYQVASHLIYEGLVTEGLRIVHGSRGRYDATQRNPWDEIECGHHYARSMASYALLLALAGFHYRAVNATLTLKPRVYTDDFACFFSVDSAWGLLRRTRREGEVRLVVEVFGGELRLEHLVTDCELRYVTAECRGEEVGMDVACADGVSTLTCVPAVTIPAGETLSLRGGGV